MPARFSTSVPSYSDIFVGRTEAVSELRELLQEADLVTIVGPGGVGKTRLSAQLAEDKTCFVALAGCTDLASACLQVAMALGGSFTQEHDDKELLTRLASLVSDAQLETLVLDNAEQAIDAIAQVASAVRPHCRVVVTSRERLNLSGERVYELQPLAFEGPAADAVELFRDRAGCVLGDDAASTNWVQKIVSDLEGMPLAIELAASRLGVLTLEQIAVRLEEAIAVLRSGRRDLAPRHRQMEATLQWSWDLLTEDERLTLAQLCVFPSDFDLEAAEAVVTTGAKGDMVVDRVESLLNKSLIRRQLGEKAEPRFELYVLVKRFARDKIAQLGLEHGALEVRHAMFFVERGETFLRTRRTAEVVSFQQWLRKEQANLICVAERGLGAEQLSLRSVLVLERFLRAQFPAARHRLLLDTAARSAFGASEADLDPCPPAQLKRRLEVNLARARIAAREGNVQHALTQVHSVAEHAAGGELMTLQCEALTLEVNLHYMQGDTAEAIALAEHALEQVASAEPAARAELCMELGVALHMHGEMALSRERYQQALSLASQDGHLTCEADTLACMGFFQQDLGEVRAAKESYARCLELLTLLDRRDVEAIVHGYIGNLQRRERNATACLASYDRAQRTLRLIGDRHFEAVVMMDRGLSLLDMGDLDAADQALEDALRTLGPTKDLLTQALSKGAQAVIAARRDDVDHADRLMREALTHSEETGPRRRVLELFQGHIALARSRVAERQRDTVEAERWLSRARKSQTCGEGAKSGASDYVFLAARLLDEALNQSVRGIMQVTADGDWLCTPDGVEIDLTTRPNLRDMLRCLIEAYAADASAVDAATLRQAGWPGEAMTEASAKNRVRVAIATLRKAGLRDELLTVENGYVLRPSSGRLAIVKR